VPEKRHAQLQHRPSDEIERAVHRRCRPLPVQNGSLQLLLYSK
jgi:hypothetical protein